jgi:trk system potassium uptake protein TrkH
MHKHFVVNIVSRICLIVCFAMTLPLGWAAFDDVHSRETNAFIITILSGIIISCACLLLSRLKKEDYQRINAKDGLAIVGLSWLAISLWGALPIYLSGVVPSFTDALFEIVSGYTTTGASIFTDVEVLPRGILFWRSLSTWVGGIGVIVLFIAILPALGATTSQLYQCETSGITFDKLEPRLKETARYLCGIYVLLTAAEIILLVLGKMPLFDAMCHSFATIATAGFSTKNMSIGAYGPYIQWVVIVFMFLGGTNFALHYEAIRGKVTGYIKDEEFKFYFCLMFVLIGIAAWTLGQKNLTESPIRDAAFSFVSIFSSTGFVTADFDLWPDSLKMLLLMGMVTGACAGSTSGGLKLVRLYLMGKLVRASVVQASYPNAVVPLRLNGQPLDNKIVMGVLAFFVMYVHIWIIGAILFAFLEACDIPTALSAAATCLGNVGPGLNAVGPMRNFAWVSDQGTWLLTFLMLVGRLEFYSMLILFFPATWRK